MKHSRSHRAIVAIAMMLIGWLPSLSSSFKVEVNGIEVKEGDKIELTHLGPGTLGDQVIKARLKLTNLTSNKIDAYVLGEFLELAQAPTSTGNMASLTQFCIDSSFSFMQDDNGIWKGGGRCEFKPNEVKEGNNAYVEYIPAYEGMGFWDIQELYPGVSILKFTLKNNDDESDAITFYLEFSNIDTESYEYNGLVYNIYLKKKEAMVASCNSNLFNINIPETIEYNGTTYSVTSIGDYAFQNCTNLMAVVIPNSVAVLGDFIFNENIKYIRCLSEIPPAISKNTLLNIEWDMKYIDASLYVPNGLKSVYETNEYWNKLSIYENEPEVGSTFFIDYFEYEITKKGKEVSLIWSSGVTFNGDIIIPETIQFLNTIYSVTSIADNMFSRWSNTQSIAIPKTIKYIGSGAFKNCSASDAPVYITDIEAWCNIEFADIYSNPLYGAGDLYLNGELIHDLVIPDGVKIIPDYAFYDLPHIKSVTIPNSVAIIGNSAFYGCRGISQKLHIPNSVTKIGNNAFFNCSGIVTLSLSESLESIGASAFYNCSNLRDSLIIPNKLRTIGLSAFYGCSGLTYLELGESVETIENNAFSGCSGLTGSLNIPNSVNYIGSRAFYNCKEIRIITLGESVNSLDSEAFANCENVVSVEIPASLHYIGHDAFVNCIRLRDLYISDLKSYCDIEWEVMDKSGKEFSSPLDYASNLYLNGELIEHVIIPEGVEKISNKLFYGLKQIKSVSMPKSIHTIGDYAFYNCTELTSSTISQNISNIGNSAFENCAGLTGILTLPYSLENLGERAFNSTNYTIFRSLVEKPLDIKYETLPQSLETLFVPIGTKSLYQAATYWKDVETIIEEGSCDIDVTNAEGGKLMEAIFYNLGKTPANVTGMTVHGKLSDSDIQAIKSNMTSLIRLDICDTDFTELPEKAFKDKITLMDIKLPSGLKKIKAEAFSGCLALSEPVILPESVTMIEDKAFYNCKSMPEVSLQNGLTSIGAEAFSGCCSLNTIDIPSTVNSIEEKAFYNCYYLSSVSIPETLSNISNYLFYGCRNLTEFKFPTATTSIGAYAFYGNSMLNFVNLADCNELTSIDASAFEDCSNLTTINLPKSLNSIGSLAFSNCRSLENISLPTTTPPTLSDDSKPFYHVDNIACVLSIPKESTLQYVLAQYWGAFISIENREQVDVDIEIDGEEGNNGNGHDKHGCDIHYHKGEAHKPGPKPVPGMNYMQMSSQIAENKSSAVTYSGSRLFVEEEECITFLLTPQEGYQIDRVLYDGEDVTSQLVDNTFTTPKAVAGANSSLNVVLAKSAEFVHATSITLDKERLDLMVGETSTIAAAILPNATTDKSVVWSSSDDNVVTIDANGIVTATGVGEATITATTADGSNLSATCMVTVISADLSFFIDDFIIYTGETKELAINLTNNIPFSGFQADLCLPEGLEIIAENNEFINLTSRSGEDHIITSEKLSNGTIRMICFSAHLYEFTDSRGALATFKVKATEEFVGNYEIRLENILFVQKDKTEFEVVPSVTNVEGRMLAKTISLNKTEVNLKALESVELEVTVSPNNTSNMAVTWQSSNENVALVDENGVVTAIGVGKATITVATIDGSNLSATCEINVGATPGDVNNDAEVDITDIITVINFILERDPKVFIAAAADVTGDGKINITDVVGIAEIILNSEAPNETMCIAKSAKQHSVGSSLYIEDCSIQAGETKTIAVNLTNDIAFSGFQADIQLPEGLELCQEDGEYMISLSGRMGNDHVLTSAMRSDGTIRLLSYSMSLNEFDGDEGALVYLTVKAAENFVGDYEISIDNIIFTQADLTEFSLEPTICHLTGTTGIEDVKGEVVVMTIGDNIVVKNAEIGSNVRVYAADGAMIVSEVATDDIIVIKTPVKGIYVVTVDGMSFKVMVK